ncbi:protein of unknown function [Ornithinimicrobium cerasi]|uniref:DUF4439 domain-containing protein n=2 Tax=Ornithinimicrobium cerasi TaxID=2248773 RepID=A0A285VLX6_9MICO|nr:protein of unknown function [Ornithinimicrobium cerasi]
MPPRPSRRSVLRGFVVGGAAVLLAGCEGEDQARDPSPTDGVVPDDPQTWPDDSQLLIAARQRVHLNLLALTEAGVPDSAEALVGLWETQIARLGQLITLGGLPLPELVSPPVGQRPLDDEAGRSATGDGGEAGGSTATTSSPDDASATTSPGVTPQDVGRSLRAQVPVLVREVATATPTNLALLVSLAAQQADAAAWLGAPVDWAPLAGPEGAPAVPVLAVTRPAVFGLEVLAARSRDEERATYEGILEEVRSLTRQLTTLAGAAAPVAPLGYDLPEPLETPEQRRSLALALVSDISPAGLGAAQRLVGSADQLTAALRIVSDAATWTRELGGSAEPFPGMTLPS